MQQDGIKSEDECAQAHVLGEQEKATVGDLPPKLTKNAEKLMYGTEEAGWGLVAQLITFRACGSINDIGRCKIFR